MKLKKDYNKLVFELTENFNEEALNKSSKKAQKLKALKKYAVADLSSLTDNDILKNSWILKKILLSSNRENPDYNEDDMKALILDIDGYVYDLLEQKHINNPTHLEKKYNDFKNLLDRIYYNVKIVSGNSYKSIVDYVQERPEFEAVIKIELIFFFLSSLLSNYTQLTNTILAEKESQAFYLISCDIGEFLSYEQK